MCELIRYYRFSHTPQRRLGVELIKNLLCVLRGNEGAAGGDFLFDGQAVEQVNASLNGIVALVERSLVDGDGNSGGIVFDHGFESFNLCVEAGDEHFVLTARSQDSLEGAHRHVVVVADNSVDLVAGLQDVLHDGHAQLTLAIAGLVGNDFDVGILFENGHPALHTLVVNISAEVAFEQDDLALVVKALANFIGASVKLTDLIRALQNAAQPMPMVVESAASVGSCQTRNLATIAGNFCTGNASADMATALLAANSSVIIRSAEGERELPIDQFFIRNRCVALAPNEIVTAIRIPHADPTLTVGSSFMKIGKRRGHVIAALNGAAMVGLDADGVIRDIRLAVGTLAPCPIRLYRCEQAALNRPLDDALLAQLSELMLEEISPRDSLRASKEFRTSVAPVVLHRTIRLAAGLEEDELC